MENLTHSLVGGLLAQTSLGARLRYATPIMVAAANLPDADVFVRLWGPVVSLEHHRGLTHSAVGIAVLALAAGAAVYLVQRRAQPAPGAPTFAQVLAPVLVALLSHPLLDWTNNYGVRPWLPWSGRWYYGDIIFIIDPWIWLLLGGTLAVITRRTKLRAVIWVLLGAATTSLLVAAWLGAGIIPIIVPALWLAGVATVIALRLWAPRPRPHPPAVAALLILVVYWVLVGVLRHRALEQARTGAASNGLPTQITAFPLPGNPFAWSCLADAPEAVYRLNVSSLAGPPDWVGAERLPKEANAEILSRLRATEAGRVFLNFARVYSSTLRGDPDGYQVVLRDLRFNLTMSARLNPQLEVVSARLGQN